MVKEILVDSECSNQILRGSVELLFMKDWCIMAPKNLTLWESVSGSKRGCMGVYVLYICREKNRSLHTTTACLVNNRYTDRERENWSS